jgi:hypothetical protein
MANKGMGLLSGVCIEINPIPVLTSLPGLDSMQTK